VDRITAAAVTFGVLDVLLLRWQQQSRRGVHTTFPIILHLFFGYCFLFQLTKYVSRCKNLESHNLTI